MYGCTLQISRRRGTHAHHSRDAGPADRGVSQLVRTGRHVSARAAGQLYGDLPSFGWALLVPLERDGDQRCSALAARAGVDVSVASRQLAVLERSGYVERRPDPRDGRASLLRLTPAGAEALAAPAPCGRTGRSPPSPAGTSTTPGCSPTCSTAWSPTSTPAAGARRPPSRPPDDSPHRRTRAPSGEP